MALFKLFNSTAFLRPCRQHDLLNTKLALKKQYSTNSHYDHVSNVTNYNKFIHVAKLCPTAPIQRMSYHLAQFSSVLYSWPLAADHQ